MAGMAAENLRPKMEVPSPTGSGRRERKEIATAEQSTNQPMTYEITIAEKTYRVELLRAESGWRCKLDGRDVQVDVVSTQENVLSLLVDGKSYEVKQEIS